MIMKTKLLIALLLIALTSSAATKVKTQRFEVRDSIYLVDKEDPEGIGFKFNKTFVVNWPVSVNGVKSKALNKFLLDSLFGAYQHRDIYTTYSDDVNVLKGYVSKGVHRALIEHNMAQEYTIRDAANKPNIDFAENPMSCWYEDMEFKVNRTFGDIVFFSAYYDDYYGGAHNMFFTVYHAFDTKLDKPISLKDIITSPKKLLRMLPKYDSRDAESKWWNQVDVEQLDNFYLKDGKMIFSFSPYAVGPFCDGQVEVPVPLKTLNAKGLLTTYGKKLLTVKK